MNNNILLKNDKHNSAIIKHNVPGIWKLTGPLIGYKKINCLYKENDGSTKSRRVIAQVTIPARSVVVKYNNTCNNRMRTSKYKITKIMYKKICNLEKKSILVDIDKSCIIKCTSLFNSQFEYIYGKSVIPDKFDDNINNRCTHGLHFFLDLKSALEFDWPYVEDE